MLFHRRGFCGLARLFVTLVRDSPRGPYNKLNVVNHYRIKYKSLILWKQENVQRDVEWDILRNLGYFTLISDPL